MTCRAPARYPLAAERLPAGAIRDGRYEARYARSLDELDELLALRYAVFNLELGEGLETSHATGRDRDPFDAICHHLVVTDLAARRIVGTYRLQTAAMARAGRGFYTATLFDLAGLPPAITTDAVEVGRACIAADHRNTRVLHLLWRGLARYVAAHRLRFLFGCCSLTSQDPATGHAVLDQLARRDQLHPTIRVAPRNGFACPLPGPAGGSNKIPKLFRTYLRHGARVCGPPAIDREFKTIDYLVLFDVAAMDERRFRSFFG